MNSMISKLLSFFLGWIKLFVSFFWNALQSFDSSSQITVSSLWPLLIILLTAAFTVLDFVIYHRRWRPDLIRKSLNKLAESESNGLPEKNNSAFEEKFPERFSVSHEINAMPEFYQFQKPYEYEKKILQNELRFDEEPEEWPKEENDSHTSIYSGMGSSPVSPYSREASSSYYPLRPIADTTREASSVNRERGLDGLAKRARSLVGLSNEKDLKNDFIPAPVSPNEVFMAPVYPDSNQERGSE